MDLKSFREDKLKIKTQSAFAELIGVEQSSISRWEKDPESIPYLVIQRILEKTGATYEELTGWKKPIPEPLKVKDTWEKADFTKCTLSEYICAALEETDLPDFYRKVYVDGLRRGIAANLIKPKAAIVGRSDTGKSTLINALLGTDKMPVSWTPTTSIAVYIKHISDKPSFIEEDAWVFASHLGEEDLWDESRLSDEDYCRSWKIAGGGVEILRSFGTRQGENYDKDAGSAVVFLDAPVLKACDIVDLPGFGTETESDDNITFAAAQRADVIIYLSQANGFMRIEDITYLKRNISELPVWEKKGGNKLSPLSNLFVVASQAHTVNSGNRVQLKEILDVGCANLLKTLPKEYWTNRQKQSGYVYTENGHSELRSRFFAYTVDIPDIGEPFNAALSEVLEALPVIIEERTKAFVRSYIDSRRPKLEKEIGKYEGIVAERQRYRSLLDEIERNELARTEDNDRRKKEVREDIACLCAESVDEFSAYAAGLINTDSLVKLIKEKGIKNKKEDVELFGSSLQSMIQEKGELILAQKSELLSEKTKDYIRAYHESISKSFKSSSIEVDFDAGWVFVSALSAIDAIGGLGTFLTKTFSGIVWLARITGLSFVSSITGGILASIFGSVGIVMGLLIAARLRGTKLFGGGWEKNVAKKIVAAFDKDDFDRKFIEGIQEYWRRTESAFDEAAAKLEKDWDAYVGSLRDAVNSDDIQEIRHKIACLKSLKVFFDNIPL